MNLNGYEGLEKMKVSHEAQVISERHGRIISMLALVTAGCLWGTGFFLAKIALREMPVSTMVLFNLLFACAGLLPILFFERPRFTRGEWVSVFAAAALEVPIVILLQVKGLSLTTVSHAALMVGTLPMLLSVAAVLFAGVELHLRTRGLISGIRSIAAVLVTGEQLQIGGWVAVLASTVGAGMIALSSGSDSDGAGPTLRGDLLVALSLFGAVGWILISKRLMQRHSPLMVTALVYFIGTLMLAAVVVTTSGLPSLHYSLSAWVAVAMLGLLSTATTAVLWNWGLKWVPESQAGIFINLEPLVGTILGVSVLHEILGRMALAGGALILGWSGVSQLQAAKRQLTT
jgi:drug/metabolite transporter (DMT)-like permease